ncbi:tetratricopeptide repeat protein [Kangiella sp. HZ709]|uniref:tetratricopeptide repeat protein n=1 Tax=Kangiella sp. HZ709 TaxID=2666328 RepID=UPI0012B03F40|nr:tetratricopeptide repeat protein [Kangiella sp. HZ709]MRX26986.1 tetratricopeptide repeat protein [Kangiella sp. HZ709]
MNELEQSISESKLTEAKQLAKKQYDLNPSLRNLKSLAMSSLQAGDFLMASSLFELLIQKENNSVENNFHAAISFHQLQLWDKAIFFYKVVCRLNAQHLHAYLNLAICYENTNEFSNAKDIYESSLIQDNLSSDILNNYGNMLIKSGDTYKAEAIFSEALATNPQNYLLSKNLAILYSRQNKHEDAKAILSSLISKYPNKAELFYLLSKCHIEQKQYQQAIGLLLKAIDINAGVEKYHTALITCWVETGQLYDAVNHVRNTVKTFSTRSSRLTLAYVLSYSRSERELIEARNILDKVLVEESDNLQAMDTLAKISVKLGAVETAQHYAKKLSAFTQSKQYLMSAQQVYSLAGNYQSSNAVLDILLEAMDEPSAIVFRDKGYNNIMLGKYLEAEKDLQYSLSLDSTDQKCLALLIVCKQAQNKFDESRSLQLFEELTLQKEISLPNSCKTMQGYLAELVEEIYKQPTLKWEPSGLATKGGSMTENIDVTSYPALDYFKQYLHKLLGNYLDHIPQNIKHPFLKKKPKSFDIHFWAVVLSESGYVGSHIHENSWLSGAFYVQLPKILNGDEGSLIFGKPHDELGFDFINEHYKVTPKEGTFVLFPSYFYHHTVPYDSKEKRISLAFDVEVKEWN